MKKIIGIFTFLLAATVFVTGQEAAPVQLEKPLMQLENSLLWEISGNGLASPSYLYGTIHMIDKKDYFLTEETKVAFKKAQKATFEIDMAELNNIFSQVSLMMGAMMKNGHTLKTLLNAEDYKLVSGHFEQIGFPMFLVDRIKPMFLATLAGGDLSPESLMGGGDMMSYEMEFMAMAEEQEKETGGLETAAYQMSMFDSIPYKAQADMLVESIKTADEDDGVDQLQEMVDMYKNQDINAMVRLMEGDEDLGEFGDLLLNNRNKNWIPVMGEMMREQVTFFAVGAGHLGGKEGVINLLRDEGYEVKSLH